MSDEPVARKALRGAERGASADASRLVSAVPRLMREARRRRIEAAESSRSVAQLATWALPRFAAVTGVAVVVATLVLSLERRGVESPTTPTTLESVILGGESDGTGDVVFDALLGIERGDG